MEVRNWDVYITQYCAVLFLMEYKLKVITISDINKHCTNLGNETSSSHNV